MSEVVTNTTDAIFSRPEKVKNKISDPIKDDVRFSALWIGHASVLLQIEDKVILLDPVFEDVIASLMLRKVEAGIDIEAIDKLDMVLLSHAHMDHMSLPTLKDLDKKFPNASMIFPNGVEEYLPSYKMDMIRMKMGNSAASGYIGETRIIDGVKVTTVFADHDGGRYMLDSYVWHEDGSTGYIIEYKGITVFYSGDTMYDDKAYKVLGEKFEIDLALVPIGPCLDNEELAFGEHISSYGALNLFDDLRAKQMIPIHYGSSIYGSDPDLPVKALSNQMIKYHSLKVSGTQSATPYNQAVIVLDEGGQHIFEHIGDDTQMVKEGNDN
jgi:N-acyl-phosphatidylethanolamine-hydrolysing phospholipase D